MKVTVVGGTGRIGSKVVEMLEEHGHAAVAAAPQTGCNTLTNEGVDDAVAGADVVVDVSNSPSFADDDVMEFFTTSTANLVAAARRHGVAHYVALSVVGCDRLPASGYLRAKTEQERLIRESALPYSIVRATQFFEFVGAIADEATAEGVVKIAPVHFQPIASLDVARAVARTAAGRPLGGVREIGGPERVRMDEFIAAALRRSGDTRPVVTDRHATYFGTELDDDSLVPGPDGELGSISYREWSQSVAGTGV